MTTQPTSPSGPLPGMRGTDHIGFTVPDLDEADAFLVGVLGAERVLEQPGFKDDHGSMMADQLGVAERAEIVRFNFYRLGFGANFEVFEYKVADQDHAMPLNSDLGGHHIGIYVDDIDTAVTYLREAGVRVMGDIVPSGGGSTGNRWIYFLAPWGMQFELVSYPNGKKYEQETSMRLWDPVKPAR